MIRRSFSLPTSTASSSSSNNNGKNNNRLGILLICTVLLLYTIGLLESIYHLPVPNHRRRAWIGKLTKRGVVSFGGNINLSKTGLSDVQYVDGEGKVNKLGSDSVEDLDDDDDGGDGSDESAESDNKHNNNGKRNHNNKGQQQPPIPEARWPISIRDEDGNFEDVVHPGHKAKHHSDVILSVPRFWIDDPVSIHQNKLMSRDLAMRIGSCNEPDPLTNSRSRGDACPPSERTIYVAIASYRDYQCRDTVTSIFSRAKNPQRVRVGVVDQIVEGEDGPCDAPYAPCSSDPNQMLCRWKDRLDVFQVDAPLAIGPVFARHLGHRMYRGEYYYMQSDAHVTFTQDWDEDIVSQQEATGDEMAVLSTYLTDIEGSIDPATGRSLRDTRPIMCNTDYEDGQGNKYLRHGSQPEAVPTVRGMPQLQPYWAAGYSFSRGHFVVNVPYDFYQPMIFQGEEMSIGIRGFTIGYDFYAPERSVCFHHYANGANAPKRNRVKHFWENSNQYAGSGVKAMYRLLGIVHMNPEIDGEMWDHIEEEKYGLGGVRTPELFYETFGIDVVNKRTEHHLCQFVETGNMHKKFMSFLRPDGMGIDYSQIDYRFKDPLKHGR
mmetsp:Transcript_8541/g.17859  ORF Transcript_8541/g.17859 Transcript_8541/m.17859 type:complete len:603 (-) Transcript_8541:399-2207(-)